MRLARKIVSESLLKKIVYFCVRLKKRENYQFLSVKFEVCGNALILTLKRTFNNWRLTNKNENESDCWSSSIPFESELT